MKKKVEVKVSPSLRNLATNMSTLKTLENIEIFLTLLEQNLPAIYDGYKKKSPQGRNKNLESLLLGAPSDIKKKFEAIDYATLLSTIKFYARNHPPEAVKKFAQTFCQFMTNADVKIIRDLKSLLENAKRAALVNANNEKQNTSTKPTSDFVNPPAPIVVNLQNEQSITKTENQQTASSVEPYFVTSIPAEEIKPSSDLEHFVGPSSELAAGQLSGPSQAITQQNSSNTARLARLIAEIQKVINPLEKGSKQLFSIGMGKKAAAISKALAEATKLINLEDARLSNKELFAKFLDIKSNGQSLREALNIHRLSPTRKNGNSLFFNSQSDSLSRIIKFIRNIEHDNPTAGISFKSK